MLSKDRDIQIDDTETVTLNTEDGKIPEPKLFKPNKFYLFSVFLLIIC